MAEAVEWLAAGRQRRSTAGNRLAMLLHQEADTEDTLFLEDEDDVEFEGGDADDASDVQMESSDEDDEDGGGGAGSGAGSGAPEVDGEQELQEQAKEERSARKRKAKEDFLRPKKVAIVQPKKKTERVSWIPEVTATRASSRTLSRQNRTETMKRLQESEKRRLHTIKLMEAAAAKKDKENPRKEMTQAERLKEAELTEERNRRSLDRWEESEAVRVEEQRKRLAALQNRRLVGPVVTWWSGAAEWSCEGKLLRVGKGLVEIVEQSENDDGGEGKKAKMKRKIKGKSVKGKGVAPVVDTIVVRSKTDPHQVAPEGGNQLEERHEEQGRGSDSFAIPEPPPPQLSPTTVTADNKSGDNNIVNAQPNCLPNSGEVDPQPPSLSPPPPSTTSGGTLPRDLGPVPVLLEGILEYATLPEPAEHQVPVSHETAQHEPGGDDLVSSSSSLVKPPPVAASEEDKVEYSSRNLVVLENFDPTAVQTRDGLVKVLFPSEPKRTWRKLHLFF